jgi:NitT/TauT family transport system permease protein
MRSLGVFSKASSGKVAMKAGAVVVIVLAWEWLVIRGAVNPRLIAPPSAIWAALFDGLFLDGSLLEAMLVSVRRLLIGVFLACCVAIPLGLTLGSFRFLRDSFYPLIKFLYPIPVPALIPVLLVVFGMRDSLYISVIAIAVSIPMTMSTVDAVRRIDVPLVETARTLGVCGWRLFFKVVVPAILPKIFHSAYVAFSIGLIVLTTAEILISARGLGNVLVLAQRAYATGTMFATIVVIGLLGMLQAGLVRSASRWVAGWEERALAKKW